MLVVLMISGCSGTESVQSDEYLVRVQGSVLMVLDFQREFEITKAAYSRNDIEQDASVRRDAKKQLLNQMVEELVIIERSKELNITVTDSELEEAVRKIKGDYPESEFEQMLLEYAISYNLWEKRLRTRLLIEKVIAEDLKNNIQIIPDDLSKYYRENIKNGADGKLANEPATEIVIKNLRNLKAEKAYKAWFEELQKKYKIEINNKQWEKILSS
ncbi:MAG: SurA N-terminal domain-containing protein [Proteobacteria bacterium]|nr:SurA N-terminal domain-containing protein [Pseudomonadota bacterium]